MSENILILNDYCWFEIFEKLRIIDWCALRGTCKRLRSIADCCFEKKLKKNFEFNAAHILDDQYGMLSLEEGQRFMQNFGQFLTNLVLHLENFVPFGIDFNKIIEMVSTHCTSLKSLKLVKMEFSDETIVKCDRLFSNLDRLVIDKCLDDNATFSTCVRHCRQLKELELIRLFNIEGNCLAQTFPHMESLSIKSCDNFNYEFIKEFIVNNVQLKRLKFIGSNFITDEVFADMADNLVNLDTLGLRTVHFSNLVNENLMQLLKLKQLKKLEINCSLHGINPFLNGLVANNKMESLHLSSFEITDGTAAILSLMKTLTVLKFTSTPSIDKAVCELLAKSLPALTELHVMECSSTSFDEIQEFLNNSKSVRKLVYLHEDEDPSMTKEQFLAIVASQPKDTNQPAIRIYLDYFDYRNIRDQFLWSGDSALFAEHEGVVKLLPLDDEDDKSTAFDYGCGQKRLHFLVDDVQDPFGFNDEFDEYDDEFDIDDDFDDEEDSDDFI